MYVGSSHLKKALWHGIAVILSERLFLFRHSQSSRNFSLRFPFPRRSFATKSPATMTHAILALEDGRTFTGQPFGAIGADSTALGSTTAFLATG